MFSKIISALAFLGLMLVAARAVPAVDDGRPPVPADLFFDFKAVPPAENGIIDWRRAGDATILPTEPERTALRYCWTPGAAEPDEPTRAELQHWLKQNQEALRLFDHSRDQPKMQWPVHIPGQLVTEYRALGYLLPARLLEADQLAEAGHYDEATGILLEMLELAQRGVEGDASLMEYQIAGLAREKVEDAILRQAARRQMPLDCLQKLLSHLPSQDSETNTYARILRLDFTVYDYASFDLKTIADNWSKIAITNVVMLLYPEELRRPLKVILDPSLLPQHPRALDMDSSIERDTRHYRIFLANALGAWTNRSLAVEQERAESEAKFLEEIQPLMASVGNEPLPLSRSAAKKARAAYLKIENPLGKILAFGLLAENGSEVFRYRTDREATRAVLALLIFERQKKLLPASLPDLVAAGILKTVPRDPFSGASLHYSRERRMVWSVGEDGSDDQGDGTKFHWVGADAVWNVPAIK